MVGLFFVLNSLNIYIYIFNFLICWYWSLIFCGCVCFHSVWLDQVLSNSNETEPYASQRATTPGRTFANHIAKCPPTPPTTIALTTSNNNEIMYKCYKCSKCYKHRITLNRHLKYECGIEPQFHCNYCMYRCKRKSTLESHIKYRHRYIYFENQRGLFKFKNWFWFFFNIYI